MVKLPKKIPWNEAANSWYEAAKAWSKTVNNSENEKTDQNDECRKMTENNISEVVIVNDFLQEFGNEFCTSCPALETGMLH